MGNERHPAVAIDSRKLISSCAALRSWAALFLLLVVAGCATPIQVDRVGAREVHHELTSNAISTGEISPDSEIVLQQRGLSQFYQSNPEAAIGILHRVAHQGIASERTLNQLSHVAGTAEVSAQFCRLLGLQPTDALPVRTLNALVVDGDPLIIRTGEQGEQTYSELRIRRSDDRQRTDAPPRKLAFKHHSTHP